MVHRAGSNTRTIDDQHQQQQSHQKNEYASPVKPRNLTNKDRHTDVKTRNRHQMATTLQADRNSVKPMFVETQLPHVKNIHNASHAEM